MADRNRLYLANSVARRIRYDIPEVTDVACRSCIRGTTVQPTKRIEMPSSTETNNTQHQLLLDLPSTTEANTALTHQRQGLLFKANDYNMSFSI